MDTWQRTRRGQDGRLAFTTGFRSPLSASSYAAHSTPYAATKPSGRGWLRATSKRFVYAWSPSSSRSKAWVCASHFDADARSLRFSIISRPRFIISSRRATKPCRSNPFGARGGPSRLIVFHWTARLYVGADVVGRQPAAARCRSYAARWVLW